MKFETRSFDTSSNFDTTTNFRFTASIAGFYQFNTVVAINTGSNVTAGYLQLYKNGVGMNDTTAVAATAQLGATFPVIGRIIQLAAGDYIEVWAACGQSGIGITGGPSTNFNGFLVSNA